MNRGERSRGGFEGIYSQREGPMRGLLASAATIALGMILSPGVLAQEKDGKDRAHSGTIHGVVAGITTEGETVIDYKTKRAVDVEAAFLTVVGMPARWED